MIKDIIIKCNKNRGYRWCINNNIYFRGYLQFDDGRIYSNESALDFLSGITDFSDFLNMLKTCYGCFSILLKRKDELWGAVDIARSMPLYYHTDLSVFSDDADYIRKEKKLTGKDMDAYGLMEMYQTCYVAFDNTVYSEIKQIPVGTAFCIKDNRINLVPFYFHYSKINNISFNDAISQLTCKTSKMIYRMKQVVGKRTIVLSLSGGYDSRYVACSLKANNMENVVCYSYGRKDSFEVIQSKKVADALGYEWYNIEYSEEQVKSIISDENEEFFEYCTAHDFTLYLQNYLAVKFLKEQGIISSDVVFITGLCNDMPTGQYVPSREGLSQYSFSNDGLAHYIVDNRFVRMKLSKKAYLKFAGDVEKRLDFLGLNIDNYDNFVSACDCIETENDHSRRFLNMNKAHEFFGAEWLLPCWDRELLDFWYSLPIEYRYKQNFYETYVTQYLANKYGVGEKKTVVKNAQTLQAQKLKRILGGFVTRILYPLGVPVRRNTDINGNALLEVALYKNIKNKKAIVYNRAGIILLLNIYIMERRYGIDWFDKMESIIK